MSVNRTGKSQRIAPFIIGVSLVGLWVFLVVLSYGIDFSFLPEEWRSGFAWEIENRLMPTGTYLIIHGVGCVLLFVLFFQLKRGRWILSAGSLVTFSLVLRLVAMWGEPIHESDFYRYIWDGKSSLSGVNPYRFEPGALYLWKEGIEEPFQDPNTSVMWRGRSFSPEEVAILESLEKLRLEDPDWFSRVSHQAVTTVYPPVAQAVFVISAWIGGWSAIGLKLVLICFDMGIVFLLISLARRFGIPAAWLVIYAWNPLVIKEFANSAHYDSVPVLFSVLAVWVATGSSGKGLRKAGWVGLVVALGTLAKYFTVLLLPLLLLWISGRKDPSRKWIRRLFSGEVIAGCIVFFLTVGLAFLPFVWWNEAGIENVFSGLGTYSRHWQYNPGFFALVERGLFHLGVESSFEIAKGISAFLLSAVAFGLALVPIRDERILVAHCFAIVAALFLLSPTAFPWYFCWVLAFAALRPRWSWLLLGALLPLNYFDFQPESDLAIAHLSYAGLYLLSMSIWIVFYLAWIGERIVRNSR